MAIDRNKMKAQLQKRTTESNSKKDVDSSVPFEKYLIMPTVGSGEDKKEFPTFSIFKKASEIGKRIEQFFNIVPFEVGTNYPNVDYDFNPGDWTYFLDLWVHTNVGPENKRVVCPKRNYKKKCPICLHREERLQEASTKDERREIYKELQPKRRSIYFVRLSKDGEANEDYNRGVMVMDAPYAWMEQELQKVATLPRGGGIITYASDNEEGKEVLYYVTKAGEGFYQVEGHKLLDRDYIITDEEIEQTFPLDKCIKLHSYEKLSAMYWGEDEEDVEKDEETTTLNSSTGDDVPSFSAPPVDEDDDEDEENICPAGGIFGKEFGKYDECGDCDEEIDCMITLKKMKLSEKKKSKGDSNPPRKRPSQMNDEIPF